MGVTGHNVYTPRNYLGILSYMIFFSFCFLDKVPELPFLFDEYNYGTNPSTNLFLRLYLRINLHVTEEGYGTMHSADWSA